MEVVRRDSWHVGAACRSCASDGSGSGVFDPLSCRLQEKRCGHPAKFRWITTPSRRAELPMNTPFVIASRPALREGAAIQQRLQMDHHVASLLVMTMWEGSYSSIIQAPRLVGRLAMTNGEFSWKERRSTMGGLHKGRSKTLPYCRGVHSADVRWFCLRI